MELQVPQYKGKAHSKFQALAKPIGAVCNIDCSYCYYLGKQQLLDYDKREEKKMSFELLEEYIKQYIEGQNTPEIVFTWHGGEPTILGLEYFEKVVELQAKYSPKHSTIVNDLQTNGTLLNDKWCQFFKKHNFFVGLSIDGPEELHNHYRKNHAGRGTFEKTYRGAKLLKKHEVTFATLTCVNDVTSMHPLKVYRFLRDEIQPNQIQFIPVVDKSNSALNSQWTSNGSNAIIPVTQTMEPWSVSTKQWGVFLKTVFDEWMQKDFGKVFIPYFENFIGIWMGEQSTMCTLSEICGKGLAVEPNGKVYSCDHYVYPEFEIGDITQTKLGQIALSRKQADFGLAKYKSLPKKCRECDYRFACHGECPKNRFLTTEDGEPGLNYLCSGWLDFFKHADPRISQLLKINRKKVVHGKYQDAELHRWT
ncbi:anaerobic sulfatase maturase [Vibrio comitans]|uniref:Anaerobic sulfatase maturase n=1 Tax=Vibrio comitans NBRC 102076 TaxID=1219078 RepID=A0A4Y3IK51_9VIBR|nr:anaerobic sulfatase maturase [Vibrio comitans]GEA59104.1 anaerobic sulfatase maturase [Vibrio comitans NBRC 102076]